MKRTALLIPVLVAATLAAVVATPTAAAAAAVPGKETVAQSTTTTSDPKSTSVTCPDDKWVYGSGVSVAGGGARYVIVDELIPSLNTVTAYAHEYEYGTNLTWQLIVWAVCGDPSGTHRTASRVTTSNSSNKDVTVTCPDDLVVTGTGWEIEGEAGQILAESVVPTSDTVTVNGYEVDAGGSGEYFGSWSIRAYATCVTRPDGYAIYTETSTSTSDDKNGHANCLGGRVSLGAGFNPSGPLGRLNTINMIPTTPAAQIYTTEVVATTNSWPVQSYAICAYA